MLEGIQYYDIRNVHNSNIYCIFVVFKLYVDTI